jgi:hypothetical protein
MKSSIFFKELPILAASLKAGTTMESVGCGSLTLAIERLPQTFPMPPLNAVLYHLRFS